VGRRAPAIKNRRLCEPGRGVRPEHPGGAGHLGESDARVVGMREPHQLHGHDLALRQGAEARGQDRLTDFQPTPYGREKKGGVQGSESPARPPAGRPLHPPGVHTQAVARAVQASGGRDRTRDRPLTWRSSGEECSGSFRLDLTGRGGVPMLGMAITGMETVVGERRCGSSRGRFYVSSVRSTRMPRYRSTRGTGS